MRQANPFVALVDDEEPVRRALVRLLRAAGLEAEGFASGPDFLHGMVGRRPDCLVLDLHMPGMSGLELLRVLRDAVIPISTIVITGYDEAEAETWCLEAGACAYLRKPLDVNVLLNAIQEALAPKRQA